MIGERYFTGFSIRKKILLSFSVLMILVLFMAAFSYYRLSEVSLFSQKAVPYSMKLNSLQKLGVSTASLEADIERYFVLGGDAYKENIMDDIDDILIYAGSIREGAEQETLAELGRIEDAARKLENSINQLTVAEISSLRSGETSEGLTQMYSDIEGIKKINQRVTEETLGRIQENVVRQDAIISDTVFYSLLIGSVAVLFGSLIAILLSNLISGPIIKLRDASAEIGKGSFDTKIDVRSKDEIGELASAFMQMAKDLKKYRENAERHSQELEERVKKRTSEIDKSVGELENSKIALLNMMEDVYQTNKDLMEAQTELRKSLEELRVVDTKKDEFISIAAHELKTPLTSIHGFSQLLKNPRVFEEKKRRENYLKIMEKETMRLADLVSEILELSRIDMGTIRLNEERFNLNTVVNTVKSEMVFNAKEKGLNLECKSEALPEVSTDREKLTQVLLNLINNSVKYTQKGSVSLNAWVEGPCVHFMVKDTGIGISKKEQGKIFDRFYQVDSSYTRGAGGTGLGLALCKEYLGLLGGRIWVKSQLGKGSEFHFTIPMGGIPKNQGKVKRAWKRLKEAEKVTEKTGKIVMK